MNTLDWIVDDDKLFASITFRCAFSALLCMGIDDIAM